jgi:hypothetical protein
LTLFRNYAIIEMLSGKARHERETMGNRSAIIIESERFITPITLYGHWSGSDNLTAVANVLGRTDRIGDPSYLTAQLFYEFAVRLGNYDGNLSFGIDAFGGTPQEINATMDIDAIVVDVDKGTWRWATTPKPVE